MAMLASMAAFESNYALIKLAAQSLPPSLGSASALVSCGIFMVTVAMRGGRMGFISPFRYSALLFSSILGYAIWGDLPNAMGWCGMLLIAISGILMLRGR